MLSKIYFGNCFDKELRSFIELKNAFIITDENVAKLYDIKNEKNVFIMAQGEKSKNLSTVAEIAKKMLDAKIDRSGLIVAVGGGVVGDISGFTASVYMRGIKWINFPTTLLAQTDSSIGGKTAVDLDGYKNIIGTFHAPEEIYISAHFLKTLPPREWQCGLGEVVKTAALDKKLFVLAENSLKNMCAKNTESLEELFRLTAEKKNKIVNKDFNEKGLRKVLNLGHTLGHALEKCGNAELSHGEYVLWGMLGELHIFRSLIEPYFFERFSVMIKTILGSGKVDFSTSAVSAAALSDKKNRTELAASISVMCPTNVGKITETMITSEHFEKELQTWKEELKKAEMLAE